MADLQVKITLDDVLKTVIEKDDGLMNELKAQSIEEAIEYVDSRKTMLHETRDLLVELAENLRGGK